MSDDDQTPTVSYGPPMSAFPDAPPSATTGGDFVPGVNGGPPTATPIVPVLADGIYYKVSELACHDGSPYPLAFADRLSALMGVIDAIRSAWGGPLTIVSGYRSPAHNAALIEKDEEAGSHQVASGSQHVEGRACDLRTANGPADVPHLLRVVLELYNEGKIPALGGVGDYPQSNWVHVDVRPRDPENPTHVARWHGV